jgi:ribosomal protein S21
MVEAFKDEPLDHLIKRFRMEVEKAGILTDLKKYEYFISPSAKRHVKDCEIKNRNKVARKKFKQRGYV